MGLIWQRYEDNEWATALRVSPDPFSLGDPEATRELLERAGFRDVAFEDVNEPVFYGDDVDAALDWAGRFAAIGGDELRELLAAHATERRRPLRLTRLDRQRYFSLNARMRSS